MSRNVIELLGADAEHLLQEVADVQYGHALFLEPANNLEQGP